MRVKVLLTMIVMGVVLFGIMNICLNLAGSSVFKPNKEITDCVITK